MNRIVGWLDMLLGAILVLLGFVAIGSALSAWPNVVDEPEDFYGLLFLFVLSAGTGAAALLFGYVLVRGRTVWKMSPSGASVLSAFVVALFLVGAALGFTPDEAGSIELRLLLIPALPFAISCFLLRRECRDEAPMDRAR